MIHRPLETGFHRVPTIFPESPHARRLSRGSLLARLLVGLVNILAVSEAPAAGPAKLEYTIPAVSPLAQKRLESASDFLAVRQWAEAFQVMDEVGRDHRGAIVEVEPGRWIAVSRRISELTAGLPQEGLDAYRRRVDVQAAALLRDAGRGVGEDAGTASAPLERIVDELFASSFGDDALLRLGAIRWSEGDPAGARELWSRLLPGEIADEGLRYPDSLDSSAAVVARIALCDLLLGDRVAVDRRIAILRERYPEATGSIGGSAGRLVDLVTELARPRAGIEQDKGPGGMPAARPLPWVLSGDPCPRRIGPRLWTRSHSRPSAGIPGEVTRVPALWGDLCILADNDRVLALRAESGKPAWPSGGADDDGRIFDGDGERDRRAGSRQTWPRPLYRPAIDGSGRCFSRIGVGAEPNRISLLKNDASRIVAFDLANGEGRLLWSTPAATLPGQANWSFAGPPLSVGESVLCVVRAAGTEALCGVASLEASTGGIRWVRPVCTVISEADPLWGRETLRQESGRVILNLTGLVAALRVTDGRIEWIRRDEVRRERGASRQREVATLDPLVLGGRVYAITNDDRIECLDAADGRRHWACETPGPVTSVIGARQGVVVAAGDSLWGTDASSGRLLWRFGYDDPEARGAGPGCIAGSDILWSTREDLFTVDLLTGLPLHRVPLAETNARGGVLAAGDHELLLASPEGLSLFQLSPCAGD